MTATNNELMHVRVHVYMYRVHNCKKPLFKNNSQLRVGLLPIFIISFIFSVFSSLLLLFLIPSISDGSQ